MSWDCVPKWRAGMTHALRVELEKGGAKPTPFSHSILIGEITPSSLRGGPCLCLC
jgi:hypothetical protein